MAESVVSFLVNKIGHFLGEEMGFLKGGVGEDAEFIRNELQLMTTFLRAAETLEDTDPEIRLWVKQAREVAFDMEDLVDELKLLLAARQRKIRSGDLMRKVSQYFLEDLKYRRLASKMLDIMARTIDVSLKIQRCNNKLDIQMESSSSAAANSTPLMIGEADPIGIEKPNKQLMEWLMEEDPELKVISVVGMAGWGKTTLVKHVFHDAALMGVFGFHVWINLSKSFNIDDVFKNIVHQLHHQSNQPITDQEIESMGSRSLRKIIKWILQERRYLLVFDHVWSLEAWEAIKVALTQSKFGNRVILTTRSRKVARASCSEFKGEVYYLKSGLQYESYMLSQSNRLQSVTKELLLDYYDLPYYLKACFLYMCMFPHEIYNDIDCCQLVRLWIAEGFIEEQEGKTLEQVGESYMNELVDRSFIRVYTSDPGDAQYCRICALMRKVIVSKCTDQNFAIQVMNDPVTIKCPVKVRRLVFMLSGSHKMKPIDMLQGLRSFVLFNTLDISSKNFPSGNIRLLKVLVLKSCYFIEFPKHITELYHLTYLSLRQSNVSVIPSSIGKLQNLMTLDLFHTNVVNLPSTIGKLGRLRHLLAYRLADGVERGLNATSDIGRLHSLQELYFIELNGGGNAVIEELGALNQLREIKIVNLKKEDGLSLCSVIDKLTHLCRLYVKATNGDETVDLHNISLPPQFLQRLELRGRLDKVPQWITLLSNLAVLKLHRSHLREDVVEAVQGLPSLVHLQLSEAFDGDELWFKAGGHKKLNTVWLVSLTNLRRVVVEDGALPCLQNLNIRNCHLLENMPLGFEDKFKMFP